MRELEAISDLAGRAGTYASLRFSVDTISPEVGALMQQVQERSAKLQTTLLFFELEWNELDDERAEELLAADELAFCRHYLRTSSAATARTSCPSPRSGSSPRPRSPAPARSRACSPSRPRRSRSSSPTRTSRCS